MIRRGIGFLALASALCGAVPLMGCWWPSSSGSGWSSSGTGSSSSNLIVENGHQSGDMGEIEGYAAATFEQEGYVSGDFAHVRLDSQGADWWVMTSIDISGVDLDTLEPDVVYSSATPISGVYDPETEPRAAEPSVNVVGCSGPSYGNYTYDTSADRTEIEVQDLGDGSRRVFFRAWFTPSGGGEQLAEGSFDYRRTAL